jgi:RND family efflux transporter MFP subunit
MKPKVLLPILVLVAALIGAATLLATSERLQPTQPEPVPPGVRVIEVQPSSVRMLVHAQGTVTPRTETELVPEVSGNVVWISPNLVAGGYFEEAEPLLRIDARDYRAAVERARATVSRAEAELEFAEFELRRLEELESRQLISRSDVEAGTRTARVTDAALRDALVALEQAERDLARTEIVAPFAGLVRSEQVDVGQFVNRGGSAASIYAVDYVEVRLPVADQQLAYLDLPITQRGELDEETAPSVTLSAEFAGRAYEWLGKLVRTEAEIDSRSRMVQAVARIRSQPQPGSDPEQLPPPVGLFVQAEIEGRSAENVVVLPRSAIRNGNQVLIVDDENRLRFRTVELLRVYGEDAFINGGLSSGERVSVSPLQAVVEGMRVDPVLDRREGQDR